MICNSSIEYKCAKAQMYVVWFKSGIIYPMIFSDLDDNVNTILAEPMPNCKSIPYQNHLKLYVKINTKGTLTTFSKASHLKTTLK